MTIQKGLLEAPATSKNIDIYLSLKHSLLTEGNFKWENASAVIVSQHICLIKTKKYKKKTGQMRVPSSGLKLIQSLVAQNVM